MTEKSIRTIPMRVIDEPAPMTRSILAPEGKNPSLIGVGNLSYACGKCGVVLLKTIAYGQVQNVVLKCGGCGTFNEIPPEHHGN